MSNSDFVTDPVDWERPAQDQLDFGEAVNFPFASPNWIANVAIGSVCILSTQVIPIIGQLVWMGYLFEAIEALHRQPGKPYPDFSFDRFVEYMVRGLWIFLVGLVSMVVIVPVMLGVVGLGIVVTVAAAEAGGDAGAVIAALLVFCLALVAYFVCLIILAPLFLRAGLTQDFAASFDFGFVRDFLAQTWTTLLLASLYSFVFTLLAALAGIILCLIGIFPATVIAMMVQVHLLLQVYHVYLARGGQPIPLKPLDPPNPGAMAKGSGI